MLLPVGHGRSLCSEYTEAVKRREVVFVDGVRTAFGRAGPKGMFWKTRADDMGVKVVRELLRRNPGIPVERIGDVIFAATAQVGDRQILEVLVPGLERLQHRP